jgi:hypothetical protein
MKQFRFLTVALAGSLLFSACTKDVKEVNEVAPTESTLNFQMSLTEQATEVTATGKVQSGPISWSEGYISFSDITVEAVRGKQMLAFRTNIAQRFNVFDIVSSIGSLNLPSGKFDRLLFKVKVAPLGSYHAWLMKGTYTSNGISTPIVVQVMEPLTFTFDHRTPMTFNPREVMNSLISFTLSPISSGITETMLNNAVRTNGVIVISHKSNAKLYNMIGDGLKKVFNIRVS